MKSLLVTLSVSLAMLITAGASATSEPDPVPIHVIQGHWERISDVEFSPNGKYLATASGDEFSIWNVSDGSKKGGSDWHRRAVNGVAFGPKSRYLYSASEDGQKMQFDVRKGKSKQTWDSVSKAGMTDINVSPDGKTVVVSYIGGKKPVRIWDFKKGKVLVELKGHTKMVLTAVFSPDGKSVLTHALDDLVVLWDAKKGHRKFAIKVPDEYGDFDGVSFSPDGQQIITVGSGTGNAASTIRFWSAKNGAELRSFSAETRLDPENDDFEMPFSLAVHPSGKIIATGSSSGDIHLWNAQTGEMLQKLTGVHDEVVRYLDFSADGSMLASGADDTKVAIWPIN